jgi:hypothetical protein
MNWRPRRPFPGSWDEDMDNRVKWIRSPRWPRRRHRERSAYQAEDEEAVIERAASGAGGRDRPVASTVIIRDDP